MNRKIWDNLQKWANSSLRKPLVLQGPRQVGKTTILKKFAEAKFRKLHYFNFERETQLHKYFEHDLRPGRILNELNFYQDQEIDPAEDLVFFDEIQYCPRALTSLKYFEEEKKELALVSAGSLLGIYLNDVSFPVGKVDFLFLQPMCFEEFLLAVGQEKLAHLLEAAQVGDRIPEAAHERLWEQFKLYLIIGGMPEVVAFYRESNSSQYSVLQAVRERQDKLLLAFYADIAKHSGKVNAMQIERVWKSAQVQLGREQDGGAPRFQFKGVVPGVKGYSRLAGAIDWLVKSELLIKSHIVERSDLPLSAHHPENRFKLYFFDVGILGMMAELSPKTILDFDYGSYKGFFVENFVAQEFKASGVRRIYSWQEGRREVEFLREVDGRIIPIEVKSGSIRKSQSLKKYAEKYAPPYRVVMNADHLSINQNNSLHRYPLYLAYRFPLL